MELEVGLPDRTDFFDGTISEILIYNYELSDEEIISVNYYLSQIV